MRYILTGKFQTDKLESRFGQYRQLSGGNYNISIRQIFECEKKIRIMSVLERNLTINDKKIVLRDFQTNWEGLENVSHSDEIDKFNITVAKEDFEKCKNVLPVIVYVAGYCCYAVFKKMNCDCCKGMLTCNTENDVHENYKYIDGISRGYLMHPNPVVTNIVMYSYIVIDKMVQNQSFHRTDNQRVVGSVVTYNKLADDEALLPVDSCDAGHNSEKIEKMIIWTATNVLLNNYCSKQNNILSENKHVKKRKLQTLTESKNKKQILSNASDKENTQ